jgi:membrane associated rhomboid family serine protease
MDWSLVLVSQGIETTIRHGGDEGGWHLVVSAQDGQKAFQALRQYHKENRGWAWREALSWPQGNFDWGSIAWAALLAGFFWIESAYQSFQDAGIMNSAAVFAGQWWRLFTAIMLHADLAHLAGNLSIGILLFGLAMARYGTGTGLLAAFLSGAAGNVTSLLVHGNAFYGLGASGMVMGALGMLSAQTLRRGPREGGSLKRELTGVAAGIMLFTLYGLAPESDVAAHLGGFVAGLALGVGLVFVPENFLHSRRTNLATGFFLVLLVALTWGLALTRERPN